MRRLFSLIGDGETVAQQVGALAQVDRVIARCLPNEKVRVVRELESKGRRVLIVGDGINDVTPVVTFLQPALTGIVTEAAYLQSRSKETTIPRLS